MRRDEDALQRAVIGVLSVYEQMGKLTYFAVPNGGKRSKIEAAIMKGLGTRAGVPDLCIMITHGPTLFIELKSDTGKVSNVQLGWQSWINKSGGYRTANICRSVESVHALVKDGLKQAERAA